MIKSFKHKGLKEFFETGSIKGIQPQHKDRLALILLALNKAKNISELNLHTFKLHSLKGDLARHYAITVRANWRITFKIEDEEVYIVDYQDYH